MNNINLTPVLTEVAAFLGREHALYIDGGWTPSDGNARSPVRDPATGKVIATVVNATASDVDRAVRAAVLNAARWLARIDLGRKRRGTGRSRAWRPAHHDIGRPDGRAVIRWSRIRIARSPDEAAGR